MLGVKMETEIREQPKVLREQAESYFQAILPAVQGKRFDMALLAARGSSDNAALYLRYLLEVHLQIPVSLAAPSVLTRYGSRVRYSNCLAIGISQSGAAPDVAEVLSMLRENGHTTLAITNTADSRLTKSAEFSCLLNVGQEHSVAATKTYSASLLAGYQLCRALGASLADPNSHLPDDAWMQESHDVAQRSLGAILRSHLLFSLARGYGFCTAQEAALKLMECALLACKSYSFADFEHGPKAIASHGTCAICFGEGGDNLADQGALIVRPPHLEESPLKPIWDIIYGQWLALLAARARGLNPDDPQHIQKVTETL